MNIKKLQFLEQIKLQFVITLHLKPSRSSQFTNPKPFDSITFNEDLLL
jgi:hypothetical protein